MISPWPAELGPSPETALPSTVRHGRYSKRSVLVLRLEINRSGGNDVFGDRAENVERSRVGFGCFAFGGFNHNGNAGGKMIAEPTAVAVNTEVLCNPAIGNDKSEPEIEVRSVPTFVHRGRSDLLLEVRRRNQTSRAEDRTPLAKIANVGRRQSRSRTPERISNRCNPRKTSDPS